MGEHHPIRPFSLGQGCKRLLRDGYLVLENALPRPTLSAIDRDLARDFEETPFCTGGFYGGRTKRFGRLLARSAHSDRLVRHPLILAIAETVLAPWCERIQLNLTQAIAIHPGAPPQLPHRDQDMWRGPTGEIEYLVNVMWPLTPFTTENGATCLWPDSHGSRAGLVGPEDQDSRPIELDPGSALLFLGSTLHGAGGNRSAGVRRGIIISYCLGWLKPYENQWLAYPPALARTFPRPLSELVGYAQHRPNLGNFEGQCPSVLFEGDRDEPRGAIDALRPDQAEQVADFVASQASER
jgi:ectoine hydroxylase-related dioxygenase (phytanoyl-CoA dioxygenase family)